MRLIRVQVVLCAVLMLSAACRSGQPLKVETVQVGRTLNSDKSVGTITTRFKPTDTMYAAVITQGEGSGTIEARWTGLGRVIAEQKKDVSYHDRAATEFHIELAGGFPPGSYKVELLLDGQSIATRDLTVEN